MFKAGSKSYDSYVDKAAAALDSSADDLAFAHAFDISLVDPKTGAHYQPDNNVKVSIELLRDKALEGEEIGVIHFRENALQKLLGIGTGINGLKVFRNACDDVSISGGVLTEYLFGTLEFRQYKTAGILGRICQRHAQGDPPQNGKFFYLVVTAEGTYGTSESAGGYESRNEAETKAKAVYSAHN